MNSIKGWSIGAILLLLGSACSSTADNEIGTLELRANGEDFVRQGFTSKDGWEITFDHVYAEIEDVIAYQADPAFNPDADKEISSQTDIKLVESARVDMAKGDAEAEPILVDQAQTAAGRYNALSWELTSSDGPSLLLVGSATKDGETIPFEIAMNPSLKFICGDFVGDERKGILAAGETTDVEATFHFDHLFGDADLPEDDVLNRGALGFDPFAVLAENGTVNVTPDSLDNQLTKVEKNQLVDIYSGLGHVGEGHCRAEEI
ncbi:MAG: DUF4382 domain-containing protein [Cyanobacteria bacterium P01_D01_bin.56]